ncbi:THAP domain-containing protein 1-like [Camponotus floridanus]|uniref:THAP domain-containing protein 1-like n=1 Tax=Camponotus floridanus TaxID=104421 RepID=UPI000DC6C0AA|nr:THAP domain-containing protein 1-like [Camponotus floridanus]
MVRCCFCGSIHKKNDRRTYHKFPLSDKFLLEQWVNNIPLKHWKPTYESLLCSDHFTEDCFDRSEFRVRLKLNSVPTYFGDSPAVCTICKRERSYQSPYSFFRFPLEKQELLNKWLKNINMLNWKPTESSRLCSSHFEASYLRKVQGKYWALKENSIPTILNSPNILDSTELLASKENSPPSTSNIMNSHSSHNVLTNPILVNEARKESCHDVSNIIMKTLDNSDDVEMVSTSIQFDSIASPVCKSQQIVDHDHQYESLSTILRRRLFECEQKLKEKEKIIKIQKRKFNQLQKKASYFRDVINELRRSVKVQVSEACLRSLESIDDSGNCYPSTSNDQQFELYKVIF